MGNRGVKDEKISWKHIAAAGGIGILLFYGNGWLLGMNVVTTLRAALYTATLLVGFLRHAGGRAMEQPSAEKPYDG